MQKEKEEGRKKKEEAQRTETGLMGAGASIAEGATPHADDDKKGSDLTEEDLRRAIMAELIQPDDASDINSIEDAKALLVAYRRAALSAAGDQNLRRSNGEEQGDGKSGSSTLKKELPRSLTMETDRVTIAPQQASSVESAEMRQLEHDRVQKIFEPIVALRRRSSIEAVQEVVSRMNGDDGHTETLSWFACELLADFCAGGKSSILLFLVVLHGADLYSFFLCVSVCVSVFRTQQMRRRAVP